MKRAGQIHTTGVRSGDLEKDLTPKQFEYVGRVALAYNEAELIVQLVYGACFAASANLSDDFISRTNGLESTIVLAKKAIREFGSHPELHEEFSQSLDAFMELKGYRDATIHSRMFHVPTGIGKANIHKGKRREILLTVNALKGVYDRFVCLRDELMYLLVVVINLHLIHMAFRFAPLQLTQRRKQIEPMIQAFLPQYRESRARRLSLAPLPTFPEIPEDQQGADMTKILEKHLDTLAKDLGIVDYDHNPFRQERPHKGGK
jgi:hypothetical protein